jgi:hypothetical protein
LKTAPNKSNKFIALSPLAHTTKPAPSHQILPPRPNHKDIMRPHKKADPKRRRSDDDYHHDPIITLTPTPTHADTHHHPIITPTSSFPATSSSPNHDTPTQKAVMSDIVPPTPNPKAPVVPTYLHTTHDPQHDQITPNFPIKYKNATSQSNPITNGVNSNNSEDSTLYQTNEAENKFLPHPTNNMDQKADLGDCVEVTETPTNGEEDMIT